jgi:hypothetical protein
MSRTVKVGGVLQNLFQSRVVNVRHGFFGLEGATPIIRSDPFAKPLARPAFFKEVTILTVHFF